MRVRVRHPINGTATVVWWCILGVGLGAIWIVFNSVVRSSFLLFAFPMIAWLIPAIWFCSRCQRKKLAFAAGFLFGIGFFVGTFIPPFFSQPAVTLQTYYFASVWEVMSFLLIPSAFGVISAGALLILNRFVRAFCFAVVEQDGTLCWRCAYPVGMNEGHTRCPECGYTEAPPRIDERSVIRPKPLVIKQLHFVVLTLMAMSLVFLFARAVAPSARATKFGDTFGITPGSIGGICNVVATPTGAVIEPGGIEAHYATRPIANHVPLELQICYASVPKSGLPVMQLQLMWRPAGSPALLLLNPQPVCNLNEQQANYVIEHDLPPELVDAMLNAANASGSTMTPMGVGVSNFVLVDPSPYIPNPSISDD